MIDTNDIPNCVPGEKVVIFLRRHWIVLVQIGVFSIIASLAPLILRALLTYMSPNLFDYPIADAVTAIFLSIYYLTVITFFFQEFIDYYLDTWMVTSERILNIEQNGLFKRTASEMHMSLVQDVSAEIQGLLNTFLDYGDVYIQTAGETERFHFKGVPHPERIRNTILKLAERDRNREDHTPPSHIIK